jgi:hypothetical protein
MSKLHEKSEPFPWHTSTRPARRAAKLAGPDVDELLYAIYKHNADFAVVMCSGCRRWQDFPHRRTFAAFRAAATAAGWKRDGERDFCPICTGN